MEPVSIVIPVYKEEEAIGQTIDELNQVLKREKREYEILIVDDGSPDRTAEISASREKVRVVKHPFNRGVGIARNTGIRNAKYDLIMMMDGDYTYPAQAIPEILKKMEAYDQIVGARSTDFGNFILLRNIIKWFLRRLASYVSGAKIPDLNSGMRAFRKRDVMKFFPILPPGHSWVSTITLAYFCNEYTVGYSPIEYRSRIGSSTFHPVKDTKNYFGLIFKTVFYFRPLRFLLPLGLVVFLWGATRLVYQGKVLGLSVRTTDIMLVLGGIIIWTLGFLADLIVRQTSFQYQKNPEKTE